MLGTFFRSPKMSVVHVVPHPSIFGQSIQTLAEAAGQECFFYEIRRSLWANARDFLHLYLIARKNPDKLFVFHRVPHYRIAVLAFFLRNFHYCLLYWGEDYYTTFLDETYFEQHCIRKSPLLHQRHYRKSTTAKHLQWVFALRRLVGLRIVAGAEAVLSLTPKHFRLLRFSHFKIFRKALRTPRVLARGYSPDAEISQGNEHGRANASELTVLVCHSATQSVAPAQSLEILKKYKEKWAIKVHVRGFLSYSGGDENDRDMLEKQLTEQALFADSVSFERKFLDPEQVRERLRESDLALFSCLRDEGVGLLTQFIKMGGVASFNKFSFNYDFFKVLFPERLLEHEEFLNTSPEQIFGKRAEPLVLQGSLLAYSEFEHVNMRSRKAKPLTPP
jgi:hypothetical protein